LDFSFRCGNVRLCDFIVTFLCRWQPQRDRCLFLLMFRHRPHVSEVCGLNPQTAIETSDGPAAAQAQNGIFGAKWLRRYNPRDFDDWRTAPLHAGVHQAGDKVSAIELAR
jgi:hypothetical protein